MHKKLTIKWALRPCEILQYTGQHLIRGSQNPHQTTIVYNFLSPELTIAYEEYLTFNPISLLAAIGGTLGIYVGFSVSKWFGFKNIPIDWKKEENYERKQQRPGKEL